jgi:hypothetical protein
LVGVKRFLLHNLLLEETLAHFNVET